MSATAASVTVSTIAAGMSPFSFDATICVVITRNPPPKTYGAENEASDVMNVRSAAPVRAGRRSGSVTRVSTVLGRAPRPAAASRSAASSRASPARVKR